jgi:hypothetical protein
MHFHFLSYGMEVRYNIRIPDGYCGEVFADNSVDVFLSSFAAGWFFLLSFIFIPQSLFSLLLGLKKRAESSLSRETDEYSLFSVFLSFFSFVFFCIFINGPISLKSGSGGGFRLLFISLVLAAFSPLERGDSPWRLRPSFFTFLLCVREDYEGGSVQGFNGSGGPSSPVVRRSKLLMSSFVFLPLKLLKCGF